MNERLRRLLLWTAGALALLNLGVFFAYTAPRAARKRDVAARTATLDGELVRQRALVAELRDRAATIAENRKDARTFMEVQVAAPDASYVPIMSEVESFARKQGLRVGHQNFTREAVKGLAIERFGITMPVEGAYRQVTGLVAELETSPTFVTLDKVSARTRQGATEGQDQVSLDLEFSYYFRTGAPVAAAR